ncbi:MAG: U32 family peptidase [Deltaproteobacteria bacterium]|nr:U32 family peptidase [Deltaproteobacteria bacterium]
MELTLGPILFEWKKADIFRFYEEAASMPLDRVYLGEVVCARKNILTPREIETIGAALERAGKKVAVSTLAVVSNEEELALVREMAALPFPIEANDASALNIVDASKKEVFAGPHIETYNSSSVRFLKGIGVKRITFPVELGRESLGHAIAETGVTAEVFAHGKLPLAFSWRCYVSRAYGLKKSGCKRHCALYPDGMELKNIEGERLFAINGTSILSAKPHTLVGFVDDLKETGVAALRISPQSKNTKEVVGIFRERMEGRLAVDEAMRELASACEDEFVNGWYHSKAGKDCVKGLVPVISI